jgi:hypothetical protein
MDELLEEQEETTEPELDTLDQRSVDLDRREQDLSAREAALRAAPTPKPAAETPSPEAAAARLKDLLANREWGAKVLANPEGPEGREMDRLQRLAANITGKTAHEIEQERLRSDLPETPGAYLDVIPPLPDLDQEQIQVRDSMFDRALALELSRAQVRSICEMRLAPGAKAFDEDGCQQALQRIWGAEYDANAALLGDILRREEKRRPGLIDDLERANLINDPATFVEIVAHHKARAIAKGK